MQQLLFWVSFGSIFLVCTFWAIFTTARGTTYQVLPDGIELNLTAGKLRVQIFTESILRITFAPQVPVPARASLVVISPPQTVDWKVVADKIELKIVTPKLKLTINRDTGALQFFNLTERSLLRENAVNPHTLQPAEVMGEKTWQATQRFQLIPGEGVFGLGQHQDGIMNYRGHEVILVQTNTVAVNPFLISTQCYGILWDNYSKTIFRDDDAGMSFWSEVADQIDYYFVQGKNLDEIIAGYRHLTGQAPMFGKWAYGYWQSKERYVDAQDLVQTVETYRARQIPLDNIVQDWRYWGENEFWSSMNFDPKVFPEPEKLIARLHDTLHVHLMVSIWPALGVKTEIYQELKSQGLMYPPQHWTTGYVYDAYSPAAREIYWRYIKEGLIAKGVDALWMDATEPELADQQTHALSEKYIKQFGMTALGSMARYLNPYSLMTTMSAYQGFRKDFPEKRVFILTRSVFTGQQRYAAVTWSGDIPANWKVLRKQISAGINYSMAGIPYWTHDIGAFFPGSRGGLYPEGCKDPAYQELYVRWFQFGVFTPIFRSHGTGTPREVWQFGDVGHWAYDTLVKFIHLRYRLLPYIYSLAWKVTSADYTLMRGLPMDFPNDPRTYAIDNQYLFGPAILVAPVTDEMYHPARIPETPIPSQNLMMPDGKMTGLYGEYFEGTNFETRLHSKIDAVIDFNWCGGAPDQCPLNNYSVRWTGTLISDEAGEYELGALTDDGVRVWLDDVLILDAWKVQPVGYYSKSIPLKAYTNYRLKVEYFQATGEAVIRLAWRKPASRVLSIDSSQPKSVSVYLPEGANWYDFWTGDFFEGGQTVSRKVPIEEMPLFVKAGSIIPLGPFKQYADEKPEDPIELRIYPGADAEFLLYEDENDTYHYEQGKYATIPLSWSESLQTLTIGARQGEFPGMLKTRQFQVVWVGPNQGVGVAPTSRPDALLRYTGEALTCRR